MPQTASTSSVVDILCQLVAIPSVNPMGRNVIGPEYFEGRISNWLVDFFDELGVPHERLEVSPGRDNILARYDSPGAPLTLLLDAHQDTVPAEGMTIPAFEPMVRDGRVTGRGSADVKGGLAAMLFAFRRLVEERPAGAANVVLSCTCDEESTATGIHDLVGRWRGDRPRSRLLPTAPDGAIIAEPTLLDVVVAHRGATRFKIRTRGRACHSSDPSRGENAIYKMAKVVSCLEEFASTLGGSVAPHPLCGVPTLSVGRIEGGTSVNVVPDRCEIEIDRRVIPGEDLKGARLAIHEYLTDRLDFAVEFDPPWIEGHPLSDTNNGWLADALLEQVADVDGPHRAIGVLFGTHASRTSGAGVPSVVFGPGSIEQAHTKDEWIEIAQLEKSAEVYFRICAEPPRLGAKH